MNIAVETPDIETSSADYASRFSGPAGAWMLKVQEEAILKLLASSAVKSVLEVGGGHGQMTGPLIRAGYRVTVVGSDDSCMTRIADHVRGGQCEYRSGNLLDLPYATGQFDAVVSIRLLPHIENWQRLIAELTRVARVRVIVDYPVLRSVNALTPLLFGAKKKMEKNTRTYITFRESELRAAFAQHGCKQSGRIAEFIVPMVLHRKLQMPALSAALESVPRLTGLTSLLGSPVVGMFER